MNLPQDSEALAAAMYRMLDDMGKHGLSISLATKAQARVAFEPFAEAGEQAGIMPLEEAQRILRELDG